MKNRFLLLLLLLCTFGLAGNSVGQTTPHWGEIPMQISGNNMTLFTTIYIDGVQVNNANYEIAAFMEGCEDQYDEANDEYGRVQVSGSLPKVNPATGLNYYTSNIFGYDDAWDSPTLNRVSFKIYDHGTGTILDATSNYEWDFWANAAWGSPLYPLPLHFYTQETVWEAVTDASTLAEGDVIMITNEDTDMALGEGNNTGNDRPGWDITLENGTITWVEPTWDDSDDLYSVQEILVHFDGDVSDTYPVMFASRGYLSAASKNRNWLKTTISATLNSAWSIAIEDGLATLIAQGDQTRNNLCFDGSDKFLCAADQLNPVRIYRKVVATAPTQYTVSASANPATGGSIKLGEADFTGGTYDAGTTLTLNAVPADGYNFTNWTVNGTPQNGNPLTVTVDQDLNIVAVFEEIPVIYYTLNTLLDPAEGGSITVSQAPGPQGYEAGTELIVTFVPADETWIFDEWQSGTDAFVSDQNPYTFNINANTTLVAISHQELPVEAHIVTFNAGSGSCETTSIEETEGGAGITLPVATPCPGAVTEGWIFAGWATAAVPQTTTAPTLLNGKYYPETDITLYAVYQLGGEKYTFKNGENYLAWFNGNSLNVGAAINDNTLWAVSFREDNTVIMEPAAANGEREIEWNFTYPRFATYNKTGVYNNDGSISGTYRAVSLYKDGAVVNSLAENDVVVLACEATTMELSGFSTTSTVYGQGTAYETTPAGLYPLTVGIEGEPAVYNSNPSCESATTSAPVITPGSGTFTEPVTVTITCPDDGAVIYYTLDGSEPTAESTVYSAPIVISETTTVSAIAIAAGSNPSAVVTATYTFPTYTMFENIAAFKAGYTSESNTTMSEIAMITGDVTFVYRNGRYMYVQDETGALLIYDNSTPVITNTYENGDVISGGITGKWSIYNKQIEMVPTANPAEGVAGTPVEPIVVTAADVVANYADYDAKLVKMETVTFDEEHTFNNTNTAGRTATFTQEGTGYTAFNRFGTLDLTVTAEQEYDVIGFVGIFNTTNQMYPRTNEDIIPAGTPEPTYVTINATANPAVGGTIEGNNTTYTVGATVSLTAVPADGYHFVNWTEGGAEVGTNATLEFTAAVDRDLVANFEEDTPVEPETVTITATANPAIGGTVTGGRVYEVGETVTLTATPAEGYHFVSWTEAGAFQTSNATYTFTATVDRDLVANFEEDTPVEPETYTITVLETEDGVITAPESAQAGATVTVEATPSPLHILSSLYFYTTDPEDVTEIDLTTMQFEMPAADVTIGAEFSSVASLGDANDDGDVNILDVLTALNYILGKNPQPFDFEQADMNADGVIDIADAMAINALIHGMKGDCGDMMALYDVVDGVLTIESDYALAGYQFSLSAEPASIELAGFSTMGNWVNGEYILVVFNLNGEKEAGLYEVLNLIDAQVNSVSLSTLSGCKVIAERGTLSVNNLEANFNVYPVPAKEVVTVEGEGINFIEVYNVMGQRVMTAYTTQVNVSNLAAGTYMFRINTENGQVTKNVVVVK